VLPSDAETTGLPANAATVRALLTNTGLVDQVLRESGAGDVPAVFAAEAIAVDEVVNTRFVKVRVLALDPALAATIAGKLVDRATAQGALVDRGVAEAMMKHFDQQAGRAATRLAEAERRLLEYVREHRVEALRLEVEALLARRRGVSGSAQAPRGGTRGRDAPGTPRPPAPQAPPTPIGLLFERELEVARLETDYEASRRVYADLVERREHAAAAAIGDAPIVRRLDPEIAQGRPLPRGRARKAAIGLLAGLLIGVALAVAAEARRGWRTGTA
jgi:uncharacterized protein involved in exopolysaccharide biosynthesis